MFPRRIVELKRWPRDLPAVDHPAVQGADWVSTEVMGELLRLREQADEARRDPDRSDQGKTKRLAALREEALKRLAKLRDAHQTTKGVREILAELRGRVRRALGGSGPLSPEEVEIARLLRERVKEIGGPNAEMILVQEVAAMAEAGDLLPAQVVLRAPSLISPIRNAELKGTLEVEALRSVDPALAKEYQTLAVGEADLDATLQQRFSMAEAVIRGETELVAWTEPDPMSEAAMRQRLGAETVQA